MKFSIVNYSSSTFLQPLYLHNALVGVEGVESIVVPNTENIFLVYDEFQPDYSIINAGGNLNNIILYNKDNRKVKHLVNIDYLNPEAVHQVASYLKQNKKEDPLCCQLVFSTNRSHKNIDFGFPFVHIPNCADGNIIRQPKSFSIDTAIVIDKQEQKKEYNGSHHFISMLGFHENAEPDIETSTMEFAKIAQNYKRIVFRDIDHNRISELFFNSLYFGNHVYLDSEDNNKIKSLNESLSKITQTEIDVSYENKKEYDIDAVKKAIESKHMPINRLKTICSQVSKLHEIGQKIK